MENLNLGWIRKQIREGSYLITLHADEERRADGLDIGDLEEALLNGQILENYASDPRGPSCLVYGTSQGKPIHVVCGRNQAGFLVIITMYIPSEPKWKSPSKRRKK